MIDPIVRAQASNALGWVSIACWVLVYSPQMLENYQLKSGEGLSVLFVITWLLGDITNLGGALIGGLIPTVVILAVYYTFCDFVLLFQIYYYRRYPRIHLVIEEERPLLTKTVEEPLPKIFLSRTFRYIGGLAFITAAGLVAWRLSGGDEPHDPSNEVFDWTSQALGWASAVLYIGSRIPQIAKNRETKCEGLSLALFMFCIIGNVTYVLSICVISMERDHLILSAPWLAGSGLTIFLDFVVLGQFFYYGSEEGNLVDGAPIGNGHAV